VPIHDQTASVVNLARHVLTCVDASKIETTVPTATLKLLLDTLIEVGSPKWPDAAAGRDNHIRGVVAGMEAMREHNG
jgi:hypothetical protein